MITMAFVETPKGSETVSKYDENTHEFLSEKKESEPIPFAYGFVPLSKGEDGHRVDCFIVTEKDLAPGNSYKARIKNMIEFWEGGEADHKLVLSLVDDENTGGWQNSLETSYYRAIKAYLNNINSDKSDRSVHIGDMMGQSRAIAYLNMAREGLTRPGEE